MQHSNEVAMLDYNKVAMRDYNEVYADKVCVLAGNIKNKITIGDKSIAVMRTGSHIQGKKGGSNCLQKPYNIHRNQLKTLAFYY